VPFVRAADLNENSLKSRKIDKQQSTIKVSKIIKFVYFSNFSCLRNYY